MTDHKQDPIAKLQQVSHNPKYDFVRSKPIPAVCLAWLQRTRTVAFMLAVMILISISLTSAQTTTEQIVPSVIKYSGVLADTDGKPLTEPAELTFSLYKAEQGGAALWMESQRVEPDKQGNYTVTLGSTTAAGLPTTLFAGGEARWLGVQISGQAEQPRVMLLAVPYAMKAGDAETLGGLPASAFMQTGVVTIVVPGTNSASASPATAQSGLFPATSNVTTNGGTAGAIPVFTTSTNIQSSLLTQSGKTAVNVAGKLNLPSNGTATATTGKNSRPEDFVASSFSSSAGAAVAQTFQLQAEPAGNNTASPSGTLSLLFGSGTSTPAETGLKINSKGLISFATGQTFPGTGNGTITGVTAGTGLMGGGTTGNVTLTLDATKVVSGVTAGTDLTGGGTGGVVTLNVDTTKVPQLQSPNIFTASQTFDAAVGVGGFANNSGFTPLAVTTSNGFGTWLTLGNTSSGGHTWNIISAGGANAEGAGNLGITDLSGSSTIWLEGHTNSTAKLSATALTSDDFALVATGTGPGAATASLGGNREGGFDGNGGFFQGGTGGGGGDGILVNAGSAFAADFLGDVQVIGSLSKNGGSFKIDHPLDPANKYLYHSFVESPDMMDIYNGNVVTDDLGYALVSLPEWFEALNRDFRYQLTVMQQFAQAIVATEVANHQFTIRTDKAHIKVSWQVTGIRQDAWANAHRIPVEQAKDTKERGFYLNPELYGAPEEKSVAWANHPHTMKMAQTIREQNGGSQNPPSKGIQPIERQ